MTAWNALNGDHPVRAGQKVLSIGTGGVALYVMQLAIAAGAEYYGVVRRDGVGARLTAAGAAGFVDSRETAAWGAAVRELTGGGVDKAVDTAGTATLNQSVAALAGLGEATLIGLFTQEPPPLDTLALIVAGASLRGISVGSEAMHLDLVAAVEKHDLHPIIDSRFPFADASAAFARHREGGIFGKVVIDVA